MVKDHFKKKHYLWAKAAVGDPGLEDENKNVVNLVFELVRDSKHWKCYQGIIRFWTFVMKKKE